MRDHLERLFDASHGIRGPVAAELPAEEMDRLHGMALGHVPSPDRLRALSLLAGSGVADAPRVLGAVLGRHGEDPRVRAAAATQLGSLGGREAETALAASAELPADPIVRIKTAGALGRIGTRDAIPALRRLADDEDEAVRRQARFGLVLVAHREGIPGHEVPRPDPAAALKLPRQAAMFRVERAGPDDLREVAELRPGERFGVEVAREEGLRIDCGPSRFLVAFDAELLEQGMSRRAAERPVLVGVVARQAPEDGSYSVWRTLLGGPAGDGSLYVAVHRTDGTLVHFGSARAEGEQAGFELRSTQVGGNVAIEVAGQVRGRDVAVTRARAATSRVRGASPVPRMPPRPQ